MNPVDFMSALGKLNEKYIQGMLNDSTEQRQSAVSVPPVIPEPIAADTSVAVQGQIKPQKPFAFPEKLRYFALIASVAACIIGVFFMLRVHDELPDHSAGDSNEPEITEMIAAVTTEPMPEEEYFAAATTYTVENTTTVSAKQTDVPKQTAAAESVSEQTAAEGTTQTEIIGTEIIRTEAKKTTATAQTEKKNITAATTATSTTTRITTTRTTHKDIQREYRESYTVPSEYFREESWKTNRGSVVRETYSGINGGNALEIYLPYGYDPAEKYNVLYLMHDGGADETTCLSSTRDDLRVDILLDTLIEKGEIEPMIVVTPTYNNSPDGAYDVWDEIRQSVIPYVESRYSTYAESTDPEGLMNSRMHRAYAGFSMGAVSVWYNMVHNLDIIAYYLPISGHFQNGNTEMLLNAIEALECKKTTILCLLRPVLWI